MIYFLIPYLSVTFLIGCIAMLVSLCANETVGIFFDTSKWEDKESAIVALIIGYVFMFSFSICYWIYKFCNNRP